MIGSLGREESPLKRLGTVGVVVAVLFAVLVGRLWYLQVMAAPGFADQAAASQRRTIVEPAPRGRILDRNGHVLVDNRLAKDITVDRQALAAIPDPGRRAAIVEQLAASLTQADPAHPTTVDDLSSKLNDKRLDPLAPVPVLSDVVPQVSIWFGEHRGDFDGVVDATVSTKRTYPYGQTAVHLLGYVGAINDTELSARTGGSRPYLIGDEIGKSGVERQYEDDLRGTPGQRVVEVNAKGNEVRQLSYQPPKAGNDLTLNLDLNLQVMAEQALSDQLTAARAQEPNAAGTFPAPAGAVVVLDPGNGGVLALASAPDYDPFEWTQPISQARYDQLNDDASYHPLTDRAVEGQYPPGSTFKLFTAIAALRAGLLTPSTVVDDPGSYQISNCNGDPAACVKHNAGNKVNGAVTLAKSLTVSSDVFYYGLGDRFWNGDPAATPIQDTAREFGLGADTGIDLPSEAAGVVPDPQYKHDLYARNYPDQMDGARWFSGDNVNLAIGQGMVQVSPLQLANAYATLGNGGTLFQPRVAKQVTATDGTLVRTIDPVVVRHIDLDPAWRDAILAGLHGVTTSGTAAQAFAGFPGDAAGKTGTAQTGLTRQDDSLFAGFAPAAAPQFAAAAVLENAGFGSQFAAPVVRELFQAALDPANAPVAVAGGGLSTPPPAAGVQGGAGGVD